MYGGLEGTIWQSYFKFFAVLFITKVILGCSDMRSLAFDYILGSLCLKEKKNTDFFEAVTYLVMGASSFQLSANRMNVFRKTPVCRVLLVPNLYVFNVNSVLISLSS